MSNQARYALQEQLEELFSKNQIHHRIAKEFTDCSDFNFTQHMTDKGINTKFGIDLLVQMALHKRCSFETLYGLLRNHFTDPQATADEILKCALADLVNWHPGTRQFIVIFDITADVQEEIDRFQYPLPMVVQPNILRENTDSGYLRGKQSVILKDNHHDNDVCLDHLNRCNAVKYSIDMRVVGMVKNRWRNLDKAKAGETREDFEKRKRAFEKYDRTAHDVMGLLISEGNEFYFTHRYDKRGRTYCCGHHANYQGTPWNKAVLTFAEKELVEI